MDREIRAWIGNTSSIYLRTQKVQYITLNSDHSLLHFNR